MINFLAMNKIKHLFFLFVLSFFKLSAGEVAFIALHPGGCRHFVEFAKVLEQKKIPCTIYAAEPAYSLFQKESYALIKIDSLSSQEIAEKCRFASIIITECGDPAFADLHNDLAKMLPGAKRYCYYDNFESFVPGGYSEAFEKVKKAPLDGVLFANIRLADGQMYEGKNFGIGFYPLAEVDVLKKARERFRPSQTPKILYIGGANDVFYETALPSFLAMVEECITHVKIMPEFYYQPHPRAKEVALPRYIKKSTLPLFRMAEEVDAIFYHQTSSAPIFALANIPLYQVGSEISHDILTRTGLALTLIDKSDLIDLLNHFDEKNTPKETTRLLDALGYSENWKDNIIKLVDYR